MDKQKKESGLDEAAGPHPARSKETLGGDDYGLPTGIQPEEAGKPDQIKPDPNKANDKQ